MRGLTDEGLKIVEDAARRHGVGNDAVLTLLNALVAGGGTQAQFSHPHLGGMGQWSQGGMIMVGDMFNQGLKYRVDTLCTELAGLLRNGSAIFQPPSAQDPRPFASRWPAELGQRSSAGSQNDLHYAVFPAMRRLAIERGGQVTLYDIGDHRIGGFSQQQGGDQSLTFTSQHGVVNVTELPVIDGGGPIGTPPTTEYQAPEPPIPSIAPVIAKASAPIAEDDIFAKIERLADLRQKDIITAEEFAAKKTELLARL